MKPTYRIKDWDKHFENHESRKVKRSYWVPVPNRHDGKSYRRIAAHADGVAVFAAWILILEAASKMPTRGVLADEDGPLDSEDLAAMTGFPSSIFDAAFNLLTQERFGWIVAENGKAKRKSPAASRSLPHSPAKTGNVAVEQKGTEQNRTEGNGTEGKEKQGSIFPPFNGEEFLSVLSSFEEHRKEIKKPLHATGRKQLYAQLADMGEQKSIAAMKKSIASGWQGVFESSGNSGHVTQAEMNSARTAAETGRPVI